MLSSASPVELDTLDSLNQNRAGLIQALNKVSLETAQVEEKKQGLITSLDAAQAKKASYDKLTGLKVAKESQILQAERQIASIKAQLISKKEFLEKLKAVAEGKSSDSSAANLADPMPPTSELLAALNQAREQTKQLKIELDLQKIQLQELAYNEDEIGTILFQKNGLDTALQKLQDQKNNYRSEIHKLFQQIQQRAQAEMAAIKAALAEPQPADPAIASLEEKQNNNEPQAPVCPAPTSSSTGRSKKSKNSPNKKRKDKSDAIDIGGPVLLRPNETEKETKKDKDNDLVMTLSGVTNRVSEEAANDSAERKEQNKKAKTSTTEPLSLLDQRLKELDDILALGENSSVQKKAKLSLLNDKLREDVTNATDKDLGQQLDGVKLLVKLSMDDTILSNVETRKNVRYFGLKASSESLRKRFDEYIEIVNAIEKNFTNKRPESTAPRPLSTSTSPTARTNPGLISSATPYLPSSSSSGNLNTVTSPTYTRMSSFPKGLSELPTLDHPRPISRQQSSEDKSNEIFGNANWNGYIKFDILKDLQSPEVKPIHDKIVHDLTNQKLPTLADLNNLKDKLNALGFANERFSYALQYYAIQCLSFMLDPVKQKAAFSFFMNQPSFFIRYNRWNQSNVLILEDQKCLTVFSQILLLNDSKLLESLYEKFANTIDPGKTYFSADYQRVIAHVNRPRYSMLNKIYGCSNTELADTFITILTKSYPEAGNSVVKKPFYDFVRPILSGSNSILNSAIYSMNPLMVEHAFKFAAQVFGGKLSLGFKDLLAKENQNANGPLDALITKFNTANGANTKEYQQMAQVMISYGAKSKGPFPENLRAAKSTNQPSSSSSSSAPRSTAAISKESNSTELRFSEGSETLQLSSPRRLLKDKQPAISSSSSSSPSPSPNLGPGSPVWFFSSSLPNGSTSRSLQSRPSNDQSNKLKEMTSYIVKNAFIQTFDSYQGLPKIILCNDNYSDLAKGIEKYYKSLNENMDESSSSSGTSPNFDAIANLFKVFREELARLKIRNPMAALKEVFTQHVEKVIQLYPERYMEILGDLLHTLTQIRPFSSQTVTTNVLELAALDLEHLKPSLVTNGKETKEEIGKKALASADEKYNMALDHLENERLDDTHYIFKLSRSLGDSISLLLDAAEIYKKNNQMDSHNQTLEVLSKKLEELGDKITAQVDESDKASIISSESEIIFERFTNQEKILCYQQAAYYYERAIMLLRRINHDVDSTLYLSPLFAISKLRGLDISNIDQYNTRAMGYIEHFDLRDQSNTWSTDDRKELVGHIEFCEKTRVEGPKAPGK